MLTMAKGVPTIAKGVLNTTEDGLRLFGSLKRWTSTSRARYGRKSVVEVVLAPIPSVLVVVLPPIDVQAVGPYLDGAIPDLAVGREHVAEQAVLVAVDPGTHDDLDATGIPVRILRRDID